ncbi:DUF5701 family protein [Streptomyces sp. SM10]|uniref:DUF5701 family protein n=1 Tax=Streptomyces sp. SM10 TaxID=565556 RepID=UPI000CDAA984
MRCSSPHAPLVWHLLLRGSFCFDACGFRPTEAGLVSLEGVRRRAPGSARPPTAPRPPNRGSPGFRARGHSPKVGWCWAGNRHTWPGVA